MAILLIRHGETDLNTARVIQVPETRLSARGMEQAERLGRRLASHPIAMILSSDYARARMTAEAIRAEAGSRIELSPSLRERNFGLIRGRPYSELPTDVFARHYVPPGGESVEEFDRRVDIAWSEVVERARRLDGDLAIVTHGLVCGSLVERVLAHDGTLMEESAVVPNTSLTVVDPEPPWRVRLFACIAHLEQGTSGGIA